jgi:uncharacterized protein YggL (DUF469 family)
MSEKSKMQLLLEAPFLQLAKDQRENNELPAKLRQEIFQTLRTIDMSEGVQDISTDELEETTDDFMDNIEDSNKEATTDGSYDIGEPTDGLLSTWKKWRTS